MNTWGEGVVKISGAALKLLLVLSLGGCGFLPNPMLPVAPSQNGGGSAELPAPIFLEIDNLSGTVQTVKLTDGVVLVPNSDADLVVWQAEFTDESVAAFIPGSITGGLYLRPSIELLAAGQTEVLLLNTETGQQLTFTLIVTDN